MKMGIERVLNEKFGDSLKGVVQVDQQQIGATVMVGFLPFTEYVSEWSS
jgi:hypothetical protein